MLPTPRRKARSGAISTGLVMILLWGRGGVRPVSAAEPNAKIGTIRSGIARHGHVDAAHPASVRRLWKTEDVLSVYVYAEVLYSFFDAMLAQEHVMCAAGRLSERNGVTGFARA